MSTSPTVSIPRRIEPAHSTRSVPSNRRICSASSSATGLAAPSGTRCDAFSRKAIPSRIRSAVLAPMPGRVSSSPLARTL